MYKSYTILILIALLIFALLNNYIMYNACYTNYSSKYVLNNLPPNISYSTYVILYKNNDNTQNIQQKLNTHIEKFKDMHNCLIYSSFDKPIELNKGLLYDVKNNLI
jgi:hypothetical protein